MKMRDTVCYKFECTVQTISTAVVCLAQSSGTIIVLCPVSRGPSSTSGCGVMHFFVCLNLFERVPDLAWVIVNPP